MFTVSLSHHGNSTDLQSFATLEEARAFAKKERTQNEGHPDFRKAEWTISDADGGCWPTEQPASTFTVAFCGDAWSFFRDGEAPDGWTVWSSGLTWEGAHDAVSSVSTLTHAVNNGTEDIGLFSSAEVAEAFAREGETVSALETPVVR
jgi:hypothetical protein